MTDEEKKAAESAAAQAIADQAAKDEADRIAKEAADKAALEVNPLAAKDEEIAKLKEDRDNYKAVALKRLGKLPGDAAFLGNEELTVAEQVKLILLDKEIDAAEKAKEDETKRIVRENSELKLVIKNRPANAMGGDTGGDTAPKDVVFTTEQINVMKQRAIRLKVDPDKFVENAKKNFLARK